MTHPVDPVAERLIRVEVLSDVTRKDIEAIKIALERLNERLDRIDDDIKAAKTGGKVAWIVGSFVAASVGYIAHNVLPYLSGAPR